MICQMCRSPMKTEKGSERGVMTDDYYHTAEIKVCISCGKRVWESYEAKVLKDKEV